MNNQTALVIGSVVLFSFDHPGGAAMLLLLAIAGTIIEWSDAKEEYDQNISKFIGDRDEM